MKVYLNDTISKNAYERLAGKVEIVTDFNHPEELDAIIVRQQYCRRDVISRACRCKLIQQHGTGLDRIDLVAAKEFGIPVCNTPGINAQSVAEYTIMLMLTLSRKAGEIDRKVHTGEITSFGMPETIGTEMKGKRLGLVGNGNVARIVASIAGNGFQMEVVCYSRHHNRHEQNNDCFAYVNTLEELFATCDYVSMHNLLNDETYHMVNEELLDHAKQGMIFINTARGGLVDEKALYEALVAGKIKAAGLDVFEKEPPETTNPLLSLENVFCGMHVGGSTFEAMERNGKAVVDNVFRHLGIQD